MDYSFWVAFHSGWRFIALLFLGLALAKFTIGFLAKSDWSRFDRITGTVTTIMVDIQLLVGLLLWGWAAGLGLLSMPGTSLRYMEHPVTMLVGIVVMHVGWSRTRKRETDLGKFRYAFGTFVITGALIGLGVARVTGTI